MRLYLTLWEKYILFFLCDTHTFVRGKLSIEGAGLCTDLRATAQKTERK